MPSLIPNHKFLLDENVNRKLFKFLKKNGFDVRLSPVSASDKELAVISIAEKRILVTNDEDITEYSETNIFSVIWLRISQADSDTLIKSFYLLIQQFNKFRGRLIVLEKEKWKEYPLTVEIKV